MTKLGWVGKVRGLRSNSLKASCSSFLLGCAAVVAKFTIGIAAFISPALAQSNIVPDNTLGSEASRVIFNFNGTPNEVIGGGAQRGQNLFHSFREFNVGENRGAYFFVSDPSIQNILARVTGSNRSDILGILGTRQVIDGNIFRSNANLFVMNPNGIIFGGNASLDIDGSFYATTANGIQFGNQGNFSAINPQTPGVLTVNPSALFFDAVAKQGEIVNRSIAGLAVRSGRTLGLLGGNIALEGGSLFAPSGRIELGSVAPNNLVNLIPSGTAFNFNYEGVNFQDIRLTQEAFVSTTGNNGGSVQVQGRNITVAGGSIISANLTGDGVGGGLTINASESAQVIGENAQGNGISGLRVQVSATGTGKGGDMTINTPTFIVKDGAQISTGVFGAGKGGNLNVNASEEIQLFGTTVNGAFLSGLYSETRGTGDAGDITINTPKFVLDGARVASSSINSGKGGNLTVNASESVLLSSISTIPNDQAGLFSQTFGSNSAGSISINTPTLLVQNGATIDTSTFGTGKGGDLTVNNSNLVELIGTKDERDTGLFASTTRNGNGGNVIINTGLIRISNGAFAGTQTSGEGTAGNLKVVSESVELLGTPDRPIINLGSQANRSATGKAGDVEINTSTLVLKDGGQASVGTFGAGKGGNLTVNASAEVLLSGVASDGITWSGIFSETQGSGDAGNITINTPVLRVRDGARVDANTRNAGNGGSLTVNASELVELIGVSFNGENFSGLFAQTTSQASGNGGDLKIIAPMLIVRDGAVINVSTSGLGKGGNLNINTSKQVELIGISPSMTSATGLFAASEGSGNAGSIEITTPTLLVKDGARILVGNYDSGNGGNLNVNASELVRITGKSPGGQSSSAFFAIANGTSTGNAGNLTITTPILFIQDGGNIDASTFGSGQGGNITLNISESLVVDGPQGTGIRTNSLGQGNAGSLTIDTGVLAIKKAGGVTATISSSGNGSNLTVNASKLVELSGKETRLSTGTQGKGDSGDLTITTPVLVVSDVAQVNTSTSGSGKGGNLIVNASESIQLIGSTSDGRTSSGLFARANENSTGDAGDLTIKTPVLIIQDGARAETATLGSGKAGNLTVDASKEVQLIGTTLPGFNVGGLAASARQEATGNAGNLTVNTPILLIKDGAQISTGSFGAGNGANLTINASESVQVIGSGKTGPQQPSGLFSVAEQSGNAGNLNINTPILLVKDGGTVSAGSRGSGQGSTLTINASKEVQVINFGGLFTQAENTGNAGDLRINTSTLFVRNGGIVSASSLGAGRAGNVEITADKVELRGVFSENGQPSTVRSLTVGEGSTAKAGDITLKTRILNIFDNATISTISLNQGQAGNINIGADERLSAIDGTIFTASQESSGGAVNITSGDILLFGNSDISTFVLSGAGGGGDIKITADSILAFDDSDIFAFAQDGKGGNITFDTPAFFGQNYRPATPGTNPLTLEENNRVDINASGAVSGVIVLPDTSLVQNNLGKLPQDAIDTNALIANSCIARRNQQQNGSFFITGSGGLPARPGDASLPSYSTGDVQPIPAESTTLPTQTRPWQIGDPVIEPSGVYELPNGKLVLGKEC
ncbi:filamentous hemagglutinin N-terminal domain-containing protein [Calothrix sp. CCY 0018]|uniref:two-partner secretion domain-containing protein n=1 Tax=Calothrix sp. CCY 0018 TaxID=3103864 RepID=UPI0039C753F3